VGKKQLIRLLVQQKDLKSVSQSVSDDNTKTIEGS
jgi:hypothetical protein